LIKSGKALLDGHPAKPSAIVKSGQILSFTPPDLDASALAPAPEVALDIIYLDDDIFAINKPSGLIVHPGAGASGPTLAGALLALDPGLADVGPPARPGLVHRLDKDTTGIMVAARSQEALEFLGEAFASRQVIKSYLALVLGPLPDSGRIDSPIGRNQSLRTKMAAGSPAGKPAATIFRVLRRFPSTGAALVLLRILTGRTHQIRVHLASIGAPVLADPLYGPRKRNLAKSHPSLAPLLTRQMLHARRLTIPHPKGGRMTFRAPWPEDFLALMKELERLEDPKA
jgi:23S rRNA pseudouridine1911/1915/1917 synthase